MTSMSDYETAGLGLEWVVTPPRRVGPRGDDAYPHHALAALARSYRRTWLAVGDLPGHYANSIIWAKIPAYEPVGDFDAIVRNGVLMLRYVGPDQAETIDKSQTFPPVKVAILGTGEPPPTIWAAGVSELKRVGMALRSRPGEWAQLPVGISASPSHIMDATVSAFAPKGAFEAVGRGVRVYARYLGDDYAAQLRQLYLEEG